MSERVRIQKALADAGVASRRRAEQLVIEGHVTVNEESAGVGQLVDPAHDRLAVDGVLVGAAQRRLYLALAKPRGVTSTVSDRHAAQTVLDLVPDTMRERAARLFPVGRLDRDSEGLLLLTNDGDWAQRLLHPRHGVERGVTVEEGVARLSDMRPATAADLRSLEALVGSEARSLTWYRVTLRQGMKRQIRRMFGAAGVPVRRLVRVRFGTLRLTGMRLGDVRELSAAERRDLEALSDTAVAAGRDLVVTIDGPGGSGKSTVGMRAAAELGYRFCDTGVLYRGLTWLAVDRGVDLDDSAALVELVAQIRLEPDEHDRYVRLVVDGRDVTSELHTAAVDREVSRVSRQPPVRAALLRIQRALAEQGRIMMAGRDIGTIVLPDADVKLYLEVSVEERARRRATERGLADDARALAQIQEELRRRDEIDSSRETAPLRVPEDATIVNTDGRTLEETVTRVVAIVRELADDRGSR